MSEKKKVAVGETGPEQTLREKLDVLGHAKVRGQSAGIFQQLLLVHVVAAEDVIVSTRLGVEEEELGRGGAKLGLRCRNQHEIPTAHART